ncbi:MAG: hypothetical protein H5T85_08985 [Actinobacteria bacterium]|nr:hypothetical protein [Actinomycetota bacterium]
MVWMSSFKPFLAVITYPIYLKIADKGKCELYFDGLWINWKKGLRWRKIALNKHYKARFEAGTSPTGKTCIAVEISDVKNSVNIYVKTKNIYDLLKNFEPYFIGDLPILPEEGGFGFVIEENNTYGIELFRSIIDALWNTRENNILYKKYISLPWDKVALPEFKYVSIFSDEDYEYKKLIQKLEEDVIYRLNTTTYLTKDYIVTFRHLDKYKKEYTIFPLGYTVAELVTDKENLQTYIKFSGYDINRIKVETTQWIDEKEDTYWLSKLLVRFVNYKIVNDYKIQNC